MKIVFITCALILFATACTPPPQIGTIEDCGEGLYSIASGDKGYGTTRDCLMRNWNECSEALGSTTSYMYEDEPLTITYRIRSIDNECKVTVTRDYSNLSQSEIGVEQSICKTLTTIINGDLTELTEQDCKKL